MAQGDGGYFGAPLYRPGTSGRLLVNQSNSNNWSDEFQVNFNSDIVTITSGLSYYSGTDKSGPPNGYCNTYGTGGASGANCATEISSTGTVTAIPGYGNFIPFISDNRSTSLAGYVQAEFHVTEQLDLVAGYHLTRDHKEGEFYSNDADGAGGLPAGAANTGIIRFTTNDTSPTWLAGVNYTPVEDVLLYAKYSTGYVAGGSAGAVAFRPEKVAVPTNLV